MHTLQTLDILSTGLIEDADTAGVVDGTDQENINALVTGAPDFDGDANTDIEVQVKDLDGEFDIVYEKPANPQTVTLDLDNPDSSVSLDRTNYPRNTGVVVTIDDQALNVDPTSDDTWWFADNGASQYGVVVEIANACRCSECTDRTCNRRTARGIMGT